ncbi:hypothetical protein G7Y89_g9231 [Cudoniella acicularis]|uniref:Uncharacterized protein n=1 Tax=Cudoniella acicularis TaxID=354080 RepID=A0A8H4RF27_9HELO|nr:hypothetical protein G7Y89_g9231 [Cudoniella acicularis]
MSAIYANGETYTLLRDAVVKFVEARGKSDAKVMEAVKELEELAEEDVFVRPWKDLKLYGKVVRKFYGVEGEGEGVDVEMELDDENGDEERMRDGESGKAEGVPSNLEAVAKDAAEELEGMAEPEPPSPHPRWPSQSNLEKSTWYNQKIIRVEAPWAFMAGLDIKDPHSMRRVMTYLNSRLTDGDFDNTKFEEVARRHLTDIELERANSMLKEAWDNELLRSMLERFTEAREQKHPMTVYSAALKLKRGADHFVRQPKRYALVYEELKQKWDKDQAKRKLQEGIQSTSATIDLMDEDIPMEELTDALDEDYIDSKNTRRRRNSRYADEDVSNDDYVPDQVGTGGTGDERSKRRESRAKRQFSSRVERLILERIPNSKGKQTSGSNREKKKTPDRGRSIRMIDNFGSKETSESSVEEEIEEIEVPKDAKSRLESNDKRKSPNPAVLFKLINESKTTANVTPTPQKRKRVNNIEDDQAFQGTSSFETEPSSKETDPGSTGWFEPQSGVIDGDVVMVSRSRENGDSINGQEKKRQFSALASQEPDKVEKSKEKRPKIDSSSAGPNSNPDPDSNQASDAGNVVATTEDDEVRDSEAETEIEDSDSNSSSDAPSVNIFLETFIPGEGRKTRSGRAYNPLAAEMFESPTQPSPRATTPRSIRGTRAPSGTPSRTPASATSAKSTRGSAMKKGRGRGSGGRSVRFADDA